MCGLFGFMTREGEGPDLARLMRIAVETQSRGHHAFGLAWVDSEGRLHAFKRAGARRTTSATSSAAATRWSWLGIAAGPRTDRRPTIGTTIRTGRGAGGSCITASCGTTPSSLANSN
jgi:hypothetical protein